VAEAFEFGAQFLVIVDFAVENNNGISVIARDGLVSRLDIDDFQSRRAERDDSGLEHSLLVRPAMNQRSSGPTNSIRIRNPMAVGKAHDAAQVTSPRKCSLECPSCWMVFQQNLKEREASSVLSHHEVEILRGAHTLNLEPRHSSASAH
jgi:hypothetical protein